MHAPEPAGPDLHLAETDPASTPRFPGRPADAERDGERTAAELGDLQERLFAAAKGGGTRSVLLVLQAMDTAGKGGIVRHVVGRLDPQGVRLHAFKAPTDEERAHDFLWRIRPQLPPPGFIGVFDRSHYEDVLVARVHGLVPAEELERRYSAIVDFERELTTAGTAVVKVMLHISRDEQAARLLRRIDRPDKRWKYNPHDVDERRLWADYLAAYETAIRRSSTDQAPWYVVPADHKWYARWAVQRILLETLRAVNPQWPPAAFDPDEERARLAAS